MIIYFSGTGNSKLVAERLHQHFYPNDKRQSHLYELFGDRLLHPNKQLINLEAMLEAETAAQKEAGVAFAEGTGIEGATAEGVSTGKSSEETAAEGATAKTAAGAAMVVWVFPIYSWGVPPIVLRFIDKVKLKGGDEARHYMVCTCGDDIGRADDQWRQHLSQRGWTPRGAFSVIMPNTYVCMKGFDVDSKELEAEKLAAMPARVDEIAAAIECGYADSDVTRGGWAWLKTNVVYGWFRAFQMSPMPFRADAQKCSSCGLCARSCPLMTIQLKDGRPQWGPSCTMCLRCYHRCPTKAIAYGKQTAEKGQYRSPAKLD
jgi:NAD-dependent dihydropyrimidine dehydrogenase PreA subunit/putative NADPH-quinone reductase